jgi:putative transcriptional regulator
MRLSVCRPTETIKPLENKIQAFILFFYMLTEQEILVKFGKNLRKVRLAKNLSQETLALDIGFDRTYISLLERAKRNPSLITIYRIANHLKIDIKELFEDNY